MALYRETREALTERVTQYLFGYYADKRPKDRTFFSDAEQFYLRYMAQPRHDVGTLRRLLAKEKNDAEIFKAFYSLDRMARLLEQAAMESYKKDRVISFLDDGRDAVVEIGVEVANTFIEALGPLNTAVSVARKFLNVRNHIVDVNQWQSDWHDYHVNADILEAYKLYVEFYGPIIHRILEADRALVKSGRIEAIWEVYANAHANVNFGKNQRTPQEAGNELVTLWAAQLLRRNGFEERILSFPSKREERRAKHCVAAVMKEQAIRHYDDLKKHAAFTPHKRAAFYALLATDENPARQGDSRSDLFYFLLLLETIPGRSFTPRDCVEGLLARYNRQYQAKVHLPEAATLSEAVRLLYDEAHKGEVTAELNMRRNAVEYLAYMIGGRLYMLHTLQRHYVKDRTAAYDLLLNINDYRNIAAILDSDGQVLMKPDLYAELRGAYVHIPRYADYLAPFGHIPDSEGDVIINMYNNTPYAFFARKGDGIIPFCTFSFVNRQMVERMDKVYLQALEPLLNIDGKNIRKAPILDQVLFIVSDDDQYSCNPYTIVRDILSKWHEKTGSRVFKGVRHDFHSFERLERDSLNLGDFVIEHLTEEAQRELAYALGTRASFIRHWEAFKRSQGYGANGGEKLIEIFFSQDKAVLEQVLHLLPTIEEDYLSELLDAFLEYRDCFFGPGLFKARNRERDPYVPTPEGLKKLQVLFQADPVSAIKRLGDGYTTESGALLENPNSVRKPEKIYILSHSFRGSSAEWEGILMLSGYTLFDALRNIAQEYEACTGKSPYMAGSLERTDSLSPSEWVEKVLTDEALNYTNWRLAQRIHVIEAWNQYPGDPKPSFYEYCDQLASFKGIHGREFSGGGHELFYMPIEERAMRFQQRLFGNALDAEERQILGNLLSAGEEELRRIFQYPDSMTMHQVINGVLIENDIPFYVPDGVSLPVTLLKGSLDDNALLLVASTLKGWFHYFQKESLRNNIYFASYPDSQWRGPEHLEWTDKPHPELQEVIGTWYDQQVEASKRRSQLPPLNPFPARGGGSSRGLE